jgi:hypothetical protein
MGAKWGDTMSTLRMGFLDVDSVVGHIKNGLGKPPSNADCVHGGKAPRGALMPEYPDGAGGFFSGSFPSSVAPQGWAPGVAGSVVDLLDAWKNAHAESSEANRSLNRR